MLNYLHGLFADINKHIREYGPFKRSGIIFVNEDNRIIVLENKTQLNAALPILKPTSAGMKKFDLLEEIRFSYWFDIMIPDTTINKVLAQFTIPANEKGRAELEQNGIPTMFPAIQEHIGSDYQFYYFSADFCDNPITMTTSYFKGISAFKFLYCNKFDVTQRASFFWNFFKPMITTILRDYWKQTNNVTTSNLLNTVAPIMNLYIHRIEKILLKAFPHNITLN